MLLSNIVITQSSAYIIGAVVLFMQAVLTTLIPLTFKYITDKRNSHVVERAIPMIKQLRQRIGTIRNTLNADRVGVWYFSNGEDYYTGNPVQHTTLLDEKRNPKKPELKTMLTVMTKVPISYYYRDLQRLHNKEYFCSTNDTLNQDELTQLNSIYNIVSNNVFKIMVTKRTKVWKIWNSKEALWVGTLNISYDHPYQMTEGEIAFIKTQLNELATEIAESDKS